MAMLSLQHVHAFSSLPISTTVGISRKSAFANFNRIDLVLYAESSEPESWDISDLGLTMDDFNKPLPPELLQKVASSGYESTMRNVDTDDRGCEWKENSESLEVVMAISGLRGQPAQCLHVQFDPNTVTVTAFGMVIWSCILRGECKPDSAKFNVVDGPDRLPVIQLTVDKANQGEKWGGFIDLVGANTISDISR
jgi:hypothetical protein